VSSWVEHQGLSNPDSHGPGGRHPAPALHAYRRFEAKRKGAVLNHVRSYRRDMWDAALL
jgi:hypothetical protein